MYSQRGYCGSLVISAISNSLVKSSSHTSVNQIQSSWSGTRSGKSTENNSHFLDLHASLICTRLYSIGFLERTRQPEDNSRSGGAKLFGCCLNSGYLRKSRWSMQLFNPLSTRAKMRYISSCLTNLIGQLLLADRLSRSNRQRSLARGLRVSDSTGE